MRIAGEIAKRKVAYWIKLQKLPDDRWSKQVSKEILEGQLESDWYRDRESKTTNWGPVGTFIPKQ